MHYHVQNLWPECAARLSADLGQQNCPHQSVLRPRSLLICLPGSQQMHQMWTESAAQLSADLGQQNCPHQSVLRPRSLLICLPGSQQMHQVWPESAAHLSADLGRQNCHHQSWNGPRSLLIRLPESQQMHQMWTESAAQLSADLGQQNCPHQSVLRPRSLLICLPGSQQMHQVWTESAPHLSADLGRQNCHHHQLHPPVTTDPSARITANAPDVDRICSTPFSWLWTGALSPPRWTLPHVTILSPPRQKSAKALSVATIFACCAIAVRCAPFPSPAASKDWLMLLRVCPSAVTSFRKPARRDSRARTFKSRTVEDWGTARLVPFPLGQATIISHIIAFWCQTLWIWSNKSTIFIKLLPEFLSQCQGHKEWPMTQSSRCIITWAHSKLSKTRYLKKTVSYFYWKHVYPLEKQQKTMALASSTRPCAS